jgi:predicted DNA-binding transcriptional regulator YafY
MSHAELGRLEIVNRILERRLSHRAGAESLGISTRQMKRLVARYRARGPDGLVSGKRGRPGNHRLPDLFKEHVVGLVRTHYADFGPTLASEKPTRDTAPFVAAGITTVDPWANGARSRPG